MTINQVLAFDFGTSRIGVAAGQSLTGTATPQAPISAVDGIPNQQQLDDLFKQWQPDNIVVGIPFNMDGSIGDIAYRARKFANRLHERYKIPCFLMDERLSSTEAKEIHFATGGKNDFAKGKIDGIAAQLILESWFNSEILIPSHTKLETLYDQQYP